MTKAVAAMLVSLTKVVNGDTNMAAMTSSENTLFYIHLARKCGWIFVRGHYLFREMNSFPRAKLEETFELRGTDNVQGEISEHIFEAKWRLLCLLSFKYFHTSRPLCLWTSWPSGQTSK